MGAKGRAAQSTAQDALPRGLKAPVALYTLNEEVSPLLGARDLQHELEQLGCPAEIKFKPDELKHRHVVNMREQRHYHVLSRNRYVGMRSHSMLYFGNIEDHTQPPQVIAVLYALKSQRVMGCDMRLLLMSPFQHKQVRELVVKTFQPGVARKILANVHWTTWGVSSRLLAHTPRNDPDKWIVPANRYDLSDRQKNQALHIEVMGKVTVALQLIGQPLKVNRFFLNPTAGRTANEGETARVDLQALESAYDVVPQIADREEFFEEIQTYGMCFSSSLFESFGIYYLELLLSGVVVIFWDRPWNRLLLPEYPFRVSTVDQAVNMAMAIRGEYDKAQRALEPTREYIRKHYMLRNLAEDVVRYCANVEDSD